LYYCSLKLKLSIIFLSRDCWGNGRPTKAFSLGGATHPKVDGSEYWF